MASTATRSIRSWLGIPYANAQRFRRPAVLPFNPDLPYEQKGPASVQAGKTDWLEADSGLSEDCLNLNVWAPEDRTDKLPVIVYVHGGGFELGANTSTTSNASGLASTGRAIGVSVNYRLGPFGWMSLSQYGGVFAEATNIGLQDIIAALQWVRENIARFGGDPQQVTVAGHSAGAYSAISLVAAPAADGLYQRLAAFSGSASRSVPAWWAEELAIKVLDELKITDNPEELLNTDATLLAETLSKATPRDFAATHGIDNTVLGVVDDRTQPGAVFIDKPLPAVASGRRRDVDILLSSTTAEVDWYVFNQTAMFDPRSIENVVDELVVHSHIPRSRARKIVAAYDVDGRTPAEARSALFTDYCFTLGAARTALAHAAAGGNAYLLSVGPAKDSPAVHGTEMHGIVGQQLPGCSEEQARRDNFVRDSLLDFAAGNHDRLWKKVAGEPTTHGIGAVPYDPTAHAVDVLRTFKGFEKT